MKNPVLMFVLSLLFCATSVYAQENTEAPDENSTDTKFEDLTHGIGAAAGFTTGYGLSYRYYYNRMVFQATFSPVVENPDNMTFSSGLTFMYRLTQTDYINFYLYESNHWNYSVYEYESGGWYSYGSSNYYSSLTRDTESYIHSGVGVAFEFVLWDRLSVNLMTGYSVKYGRFHHLYHEFLNGELS
ncbi:MAG TPA: hypothetical protein VJ946_02200, partial [Bacteroidales bacterium]|nr:hypothetical protein [Bacteroidales bacterium]